MLKNLLKERLHAPVSGEKTVTISIDSSDFEVLKKNGYHLCFAKKLRGHDYDVVWQSYDKESYLESNTFSWISSFQIFGANVFQDNVRVRTSTNTVSIRLGEQCTINQEGHIEGVKTGSYPDSIELINKFGAIHPGVNALCYDLRGNQQVAPIYVAPEAIVIGTDVLTPIEKVQVWFEQNIETGTMFSDARTNVQEIDLTNQPAVAYLYKGGQWYPA